MFKESVNNLRGKSVFYDGFFAMGTRCEVVISDIEERFANSVYNEIREEILRIDRKLNRFSRKSIIRKINQEASKSPVNLDTEMRDILSECIKYSRITHGAFDITVGPLLDMLVSRGMESINKKELLKKEIKDFYQIVGYKNILLNSEKRTIFLERPGMGIDLGGFGKGYALEQIRKMLIRNEIENALICFGGSSVLALGHHPFGNGWNIGIKYPDNEISGVYEFNLWNHSLSTSSTLRNSMKNDSRFYGHIINPRTGYLVEGLRTISVASDSSIEAEILSTALLVMNPEEKRELLEKYSLCRVVEFNFDNNQIIKINSWNV